MVKQIQSMNPFMNTLKRNPEFQAFRQRFTNHGFGGLFLPVFFSPNYYLIFEGCDSRSHKLKKSHNQPEEHHNHKKPEGYVSVTINRLVEYDSYWCSYLFGDLVWSSSSSLASKSYLKKFHEKKIY